MATARLHLGLWIRQPLPGKQNVRITFVPDNTKKHPDSVPRINDAGEKQAWAKFFGAPFTTDPDMLDTGIAILRFNRGNLSGTATFVPEDASQKLTIHPFQWTGTDPEHDTQGLKEFNECMAGKKETLNPYNELTAFCQCL